jgi:hypothetical protein
MVPSMPEEQLPSHARSLLNAACLGALRLSPSSVRIAQQTLNAVSAMLDRATSTPAANLSASWMTLLADSFWRALLLMQSDCVALYHDAAALLEKLLTICPLDAQELRRTLPGAAPPCWAATGSAKAAVSTASFPGVQPLLLPGLSRAQTREVAIGVQCHLASISHEPNALVESERTRIISAVAALLPWLCETYKASGQSKGASGGASTAAAAGALASPAGGASSSILDEGSRGKLTPRALRATTELWRSCTERVEQGRAELLHLANLLRRYANADYDHVGQFITASRRALAAAIGPLAPVELYPIFCSLLSAAAETTCWAGLLHLTRFLLKHLPPESNGSHSAAAASAARLVNAPLPHIWRSAIEAARATPECAPLLTETIDQFLAMCRQGRMLRASRDKKYWAASHKTTAAEALQGPLPTLEEGSTLKEGSPPSAHETNLGATIKLGKGDKHGGGAVRAAQHASAPAPPTQGASGNAAGSRRPSLLPEGYLEGIHSRLAAEKLNRKKGGGASSSSSDGESRGSSDGESSSSSEGEDETKPTGDSAATGNVQTSEEVRAQRGAAELAAAGENTEAIVDEVYSNPPSDAEEEADPPSRQMVSEAAAVSDATPKGARPADETELGLAEMTSLPLSEQCSPAQTPPTTQNMAADRILMQNQEAGADEISAAAAPGSRRKSTRKSRRESQELVRQQIRRLSGLPSAPLALD